MKYRNEKIDVHMELIESLLTAISEKKSSAMDVVAIMKEDEQMSFDKAVQIGMQRTANESLVATKALAIGFDRVVAMVEQMTEEMDNANMPNGGMYKNRLKVITNFQRIMNELNPTMANQFARR